MTHEELWRALDTLAAEKGLSASGLARLAGLDPTSFNRSKRTGSNGPRWPGTESLARVLDAAGIGLDSFATLVSGGRVLPSGRASRALPLMVFSRLGAQAPEQDAIEAAGERITLPFAPSDVTYVVRLDEPRFAPALRRNDLLLVAPSAVIMPGDRVLAFDGGDAPLPCLAARPLPTRLDTGEALGGAATLHRISWIGG